MDASSLVSQVLVSLLAPTGLGAIFLIRQQRQKFVAEARATSATADETDAKAEVLLSGEALELFRAARSDATEARAEAREARAEAATARLEAEACRRTAVEVWAALDAYDRHVRRQDALITDLGGAPLHKPPELTPRIRDAGQGHP